MNSPIRYFDAINMNITNRGTLTIIHTADIQFGCMDPFTEYKILKEQLIDKVRPLTFDILSVNGDLYDRKYMSNSDPVKYATLFVADLVKLCKEKNATLIIISGTKEHDAGQLVLFYHYLK